MKLLLFSDLHCDTIAARSLVKRAASVDVLVGAGDFGKVRRDIGVCIDVLRTIDKPAVLVVSEMDYPGWKATVDGQPELLATGETGPQEPGHGVGAGAAGVDRAARLVAHPGP